MEAAMGHVNWSSRRSARAGFEFSSLVRQMTGKATARDQDWRSSFRQTGQ